MRAATLWLLAACAVSGSALASEWSDLWATPEQQAQHLLDSRHAAAAAPLFKDPRRRGYAELRAGQYAQAAKSLAPLRDADSLYNRGNALAHTDQLRDALAAYDAALKQSPGNGDIVHNRDLVARALQKQQQTANKPQGGGSGKQQGGAGGQQGGSGRQGQHGDASASGGTQAASGSGQQEQHGDASASGGTQAASGSGQQEQHGSTGASGGTQAASGGGQQPGHDQGKQQAQANSQAGKSLGPSGQQGGTGDARGSPQSASAAQPGSATQQQGAATPNAEPRVTRAAGETQPPPPPRSEQSLALDQWLRGIPDDSGELLRRKFLIEHMMKQRQGNPQ